jgi:hypothetical protein
MKQSSAQTMRTPQRISPALKALIGVSLCVLGCSGSSFQNNDDGDASAAPSSETPDGLVAAYGFEEGDGVVVNDASGHGNVGAISGATWTNDGRFGNALHFGENSNSWVTVDDDDSLDLRESMTLEAWLYPTVEQPVYPTVILKETPTNLAYALYARADAEGPGVFYTAFGEQHSAQGGSVLALETWTHLAATFNGDELTLFVNGELIATAPTENNIDLSEQPLRIGGNSLWPQEFFFGRIDEVRIYSRALTPEEIVADMEAAVTAE